MEFYDKLFYLSYPAAGVDGADCSQSSGAVVLRSTDGANHSRGRGVMLVGLLVLLWHINPLHILIFELVRWGSGPLEDLVEVEDVFGGGGGDCGHGQGAGT